MEISWMGMSWMEVIEACCTHTQVGDIHDPGSVIYLINYYLQI